MRRWLYLGTSLVGCTPAVDVGGCPAGTHARDDGRCWLDARGGERLAPPEGDSCATPPPPLLSQCTAAYPGDLLLEDDAAVGAFCDQWDCVSGGLSIGRGEGGGGQPTSAVTSLAPLACLKAARFVLVSLNDGLDRVRLDGLVQTGGGLNVTGNRGAAALELPALRWIGGDLAVQSNAGLTHIDLPMLERVGEFFVVADNPHLPQEDAWAVRRGLCDDAVGAATTILHNGGGR